MNAGSVLRKLLRIGRLGSHQRTVCSESEVTRLLVGQLLVNQLHTRQCRNLRDAEFRVSSQWGDDGIIQFLVHTLNIERGRFIEFGVADYRESTTRFLLQNNNWSGLVMDGTTTNIESIRKNDLYWRHDLTAVQAFVTTENVNTLFRENGFAGDVELLHIDVDGNEYWIWRAIDCINPVIAILEYNSLFGDQRAITVPYDPAFERMKAHHSGLFAGASLTALCDLAHDKGYSFIGSNSAGNNAYFIRNDRLGDLQLLSVKEGYVAARFREHRDEHGRLTFQSGMAAIESIRGMQVFNTRTNEYEAL